MIRLLMSGLLVIASLSLAAQQPGSGAHGSEAGDSQFLLAATSGSAPVVIGKTSRTIQLARKQVGKDGGPDEPSEIPAIGYFPISANASGRAARSAHSGYEPEHILFRSGTRSISPRAPPTHVSV
tara:strand:- start:2430 stop:2804 length:375 start_codon:yes stop_codon:yes gene_type:complete